MNATPLAMDKKKTGDSPRRPASIITFVKPIASTT